MDFERDERAAAQSRQAERGLPADPRVEADGTRMATREVPLGTAQDGVGLEEEARMEETVRRGSRAGYG